MTASRKKLLTKDFYNIGLSLAYDGMTIYPKADEKDATKVNQDSVQLPARPKFKRRSDDIHYRISMHVLIKSLDDICDILPWQRNIMQYHPDHNLYHQDNYARDHHHWHLKFTCPLARAHLSQALAVFVAYQIITSDEAQAFLREYDDRYESQHTKLSRRLTQEREADFKIILHYVRACTQNDLLIDLHQYLVSPWFDYLRHQPEQAGHQYWLGTDADGDVIHTSSCWAKIEKAIALQMAQNIRSQCSRFTAPLAEERGRELGDYARFFWIKHKSENNESVMSSMYMAFCCADEETLTAKYQKMFGK